MVNTTVYFNNNHKPGFVIFLSRKNIYNSVYARLF